MQALLAMTVPTWGAVLAWVVIGSAAIVHEVRWHREVSRSRRAVRRIREWSE